MRKEIKKLISVLGQFVVLPSGPLIFGWLFLPLAQAGTITVDTSFGRTIQTFSGSTLNIPASLGKLVPNSDNTKANLFHSFSQFDLVNGDVATFFGPQNIQVQNVLTRITGRNASSIDGTIQTDSATLSGANFFFINPAGVMFGPHANAIVSGSFVVTTANYLRLADGSRFVAELGADDSALSAAPVSAFGFLGNNPPQPISIESALSVPNGNSFSIVGGDITVDGGAAKAPGGRVNLVSVKSAGEVGLDATDPAAVVDIGAFPQQGQITLQNSALVDVGGPGSGQVVIRGGVLKMVGGAVISADTSGSLPGGNVDIKTGFLQLSDRAAISVSTSGSGHGGSMTIVADSVDVSSGATLRSSSPPGLGDGGSIEVTAHSILLDGTGSAIVTGISAEVGGANLGALGPGKGGDIAITTSSLEILNGAQISASTFSLGAGGRIEITADSIHVDGRHPQVFGRVSSISATTGSADPNLARSLGTGGDIVITTGSLDILDHAQVSATAYGFGNGGSINIEATSLAIRDTGTIESKGAASGLAGNIRLDIKGSLFLSDRSAIVTSSPQSSGGDITVSAGNKIRLIDSQITTQAGLDGGNLSLSSPSLIYLLHSTLTAEADATSSGHGNGGNITIDPSFLILHGSSIIAKSSLGNGGNITILSDFFLQSDSLIDASAPFGLPGTVEVSAPEIDLSGSLAVLPASLLDAQAQLQEQCARRFSEGISSFIVVGRGGMLVEQGGLLTSFDVKEANSKR